MTILQVESLILEQLKIYSDDGLDSRYILDLLSLNRSVALTNRYNTGIRSFDQMSVQDICLQLELVDSATCCSLVPSGCSILKSKTPVPSILDLHNKLAVKSVTAPLVMGKPISFIDRNRAAFVGRDSITKNMLYAFIYNDYLYVWSGNKKNLLIESVILSAVFENFLEAAKLECNSSGTNCYNPETAVFPLMENLLVTIVIPQVVNTILRSFGVPKDENNNARSEQENLSQGQPKQ